jgi:hypothetical protein
MAVKRLFVVRCPFSDAEWAEVDFRHPNVKLVGEK